MTYPRILAIDFGLKQVGLAVSDPLGITAQSLCVIKVQNNKETLAEVVKHIEKLGVTKIIMGNPLRFGGSPGTINEQIERFAVKLEGATGIKVVMVDERLTTLQAEKMLISADVRRSKRKEVIDKIAAQMLLQGYMDSQSRVSPTDS